VGKTARGIATQASSSSLTNGMQESKWERPRAGLRQSDETRHTDRP